MPSQKGRGGDDDILLAEEFRAVQRRVGVWPAVHRQIHLVPQKHLFQVVREVKVDAQLRMGREQRPQFRHKNGGAELDRGAEGNAKGLTGAGAIQLPLDLFEFLKCRPAG